MIKIKTKYLFFMLALGAFGSDLRMQVQSVQAVPVVSSRQSALDKILHREVEKIGNFLTLPAATFTMGSSGTEAGRVSPLEKQNEVTLEEFEIMDTELTQEEYVMVMGENPSYFQKENHCPSVHQKFELNGKDVQLCLGYPVENVSWMDVWNFISKLNELLRFSGYIYGLPTKAQSEYAIRGNTTTAYISGNEPSGLHEYVWRVGITYPSYKTYPVKSKRANSFGYYRGSVSEWLALSGGDAYVADGHLNEYRRALYHPNPIPAREQRVRDARFQSASRELFFPEERNKAVGFRLVRTNLKRTSASLDVPRLQERYSSDDVEKAKTVLARIDQEEKKSCIASVFEFYTKADRDSIISGLASYIHNRSELERDYNPDLDPIFRYFPPLYNAESKRLDLSKIGVMELVSKDYQTTRACGGNVGSVTELIAKNGMRSFFKKARRDSNANLNAIRHQISADLLNNLLELNFIPSIRPAKLDGNLGTLQAAVPLSFRAGGGEGRGNPEFKAVEYQNALRQLKVFDYIANSDDRHSGNLFFNAEAGQVRSIDHDTSFSIGLVIHDKRNEFAPSLLPHYYSAEIRSRVNGITFQQLKDTFRVYLTEDEIASMWLRVLIVQADMKKKP